MTADASAKKGRSRAVGIFICAVGACMLIVTNAVFGLQYGFSSGHRSTFFADYFNMPEELRAYFLILIITGFLLAIVGAFLVVNEKMTSLPKSLAKT